MRPDVLNPLFAETATLDGVGPKLQKPLDNLGLTRVRDVVYHLPERFVTRRPVANLDEASEGEPLLRLQDALDVGHVVSKIEAARRVPGTRENPPEGIGRGACGVSHRDLAGNSHPVSDLDVVQLLHQRHLRAGEGFRHGLRLQRPGHDVHVVFLEQRLEPG